MNLLCRVLNQFLYWAQLHLNVISFVFRKSEEKKQVPPCNDPLLNASAKELAEKIRTKQITSEDLIKAYVRRINEVNPIINAVVENRFDGAIEDARKVDEFLTNDKLDVDDLRKNKPLLGIPVTVKECLALKGLSHTGCSMTREGVKAEEDSDAVALIKEAGAIPLLVSSTPEYCTSVQTDNSIIGRTNNPYDTRRTCGGSSGGEGALIGSGSSLIGIGTDVAGSIRLPCACNGIFGHKPTSGAVSTGGIFPTCSDAKFYENLCVGPLTRYAEDLKLTFKILVRPDKIEELRLDQKVDLTKLTVYYMVDAHQDLGLGKVQHEVKTAIEQAAGYLRNSSHCTVSDHKFEEMGDSLEISSALAMNYDPIPDVLTDSEIKYGLCKEIFKKIFRKSIFTWETLIFTALSRVKFMTTANDRKKYQIMAREYKKNFVDKLGDSGVLLLPSWPTCADKHGHFLSAIPKVRFLAIMSVLGLPATCVPVGLDMNDLPIGLQVIAAPNQDRLTLAVAEELEKYFGGWQPASADA